MLLLHAAAAAAPGRQAAAAGTAAAAHHQLSRALSAATDATLLQRLQSHFSASTSSSCSSGSSSSDRPSAPPPQQQQQQAPRSSIHQQHQHHHQQWPTQHQQQQQQQQQQQSSVLPWAFFSSTRGFADDSRAGSMGRRRRLPGQQQGFQQLQQQPSGAYQQRQQLGRVAALCQPTERLRAPVLLDDPSYNPYTDHSPELINPRMVNGTRGDDLDASLLMRQQVENSRLPTELKRSALIGGPSWDQLLLHVNRTVKVTKGGKVETLHAMVAVGNADGLIGVGEHSGKNIQKVTMDAQLKAYKNLVAIPRYREHTVFHPLDVQNRKIRMRVWPRVAGFGITASPLITQLCDLAGIRDATIKLTGRRRNIRNVVYTFIDALLSQSLPHDGVEGTGVYMREVYYARQLPCGLKRGVDVP